MININELPKKNNDCVYMLYFDGNIKNKYYGRTAQLYNRIKMHLFYLIKNKHSNKNLQRAFNHYGIKQLNIIKICDVKTSFEEDNLIKNDNYCYNRMLIKVFNPYINKTIKILRNFA